MQGSDERGGNTKTREKGRGSTETKYRGIRQRPWGEYATRRGTGRGCGWGRSRRGKMRRGHATPSTSHGPNCSTSITRNGGEQVIELEYLDNKLLEELLIEPNNEDYNWQENKISHFP
ncbi:ethylene-responsive transcription factor 14-like [Rhododendron vialii]|uniref:ethylene-responsive transcription factor 14-like n=1 Tax=Rhododendron vialii TaxID=182163 RepID=UPI00265FD357|nr:ethylene-responsive transcription factor 14-like [Rhododendron vialii]